MTARTTITFTIMLAAMASAANAQPAPAVPAAQSEAPRVVAIPLAPPSMVASHEPSTPSPPASVVEWYGWQILVADGSLLSVAVATRSSGIAYGWLGSGAVVHWARGNVGRDIASVGLRVGLPMAGVLIGIGSASGCHGDWCGFGEAIAGGLIGVVSAEVIDVSLLGRDSAPVPAAVHVARRVHGVEVSPVIRAARSGVGLDLVGRF